MEYAELNINRSLRDREGIKENRMHARVAHNPSEANPGDTLNVRMPKLDANSVIYRNSLGLSFDYKLNSGKDESDIPDHLTSAIVKRLTITFEGQIVFDTNDRHHLATFKEFWYPKHEYDNELEHIGIQSAATKKKRHVAGSPEDVLGTINGERYVFKLGSFLTDAAFCPQAIHNNVMFNITLAEGEYTLKNIKLEYDYILNQQLADSCKSKYVNHRHIINRYAYKQSYDVPTTAGDIEINIAATFDSLRAILIFFPPSNNAGTTYQFPNLTGVEVDIDGAGGQLYGGKYLPQYAWDDAKRFFLKTSNETKINKASFYTDKFCLALDLRTINDERSSGVGREIRDNVRIKLTKGATSAACKAVVYLVSDRAIYFRNNQLLRFED